MPDLVLCIVNKSRLQWWSTKPAQRGYALLPLLLMSYAFQVPKAEAPLTSNTVPLSLRMETITYSSVPKWTLTVDKVGIARLTIETHPLQTRTFQVSDEQIAAFRKAITNEHFFDLRKEYGVQVPDGGWRTLSVTVGKQRKEITLRDLRESDAHLLEVQRALRLWYAAQHWFTDPGVKEFSSQDQNILDAKPPTVKQ